MREKLTTCLPILRYVNDSDNLHQSSLEQWKNVTCREKFQSNDDLVSYSNSYLLSFVFVFIVSQLHAPIN